MNRTDNRKYKGQSSDQGNVRVTAREDASGGSGRTASRSRLGRPTQSALPGLDRIECTATHKGLISLFIRFAGNKCRDLGVVLAHLQ